MGFFPQEKVSSIPAVVIDPASNNEGEGEHEVIMNEFKDATTEMGAQVTDTSLSETSQSGNDQKPAEEVQAVLSQDQPVPAEDAASAMPPGFLYKVCFSLLLLDIPGCVLSAPVVS